MKTVQEIYPESNDGGHFWAPGDYRPLLESLGSIVLQVDDGGYQGDSRVLFQDGERWGILEFGWGSCSGCDALQGCSNYKEIEDLREHLAGSIHWGTKEETLSYLMTHDWEGDYSWHKQESREFVRRAIVLVAGDSKIADFEEAVKSGKCHPGVYADWCEENGYIGRAQLLRKGEEA